MESDNQIRILDFGGLESAHLLNQIVELSLSLYIAPLYRKFSDAKNPQEFFVRLVEQSEEQAADDFLFYLSIDDSTFKNVLHFGYNPLTDSRCDDCLEQLTFDQITNVFKKVVVKFLKQLKGTQFFFQKVARLNSQEQSSANTQQS